MSETNATQGKLSGIKNSITFKMFVIGFLVLILLIPLFFVRDLIKERESTRNQAISEINDSWGAQVYLAGPFLRVPYYRYDEVEKIDQKTGKTTKLISKEIAYAYFLPDQINLEGKIDAENKKLGIYETAVYNLNSTMKGKFSTPNFGSLEIENKSILWDKAQFVIQTSNIKGISNQIYFKTKEQSLNFTSDLKKTQNDYDYTSNHNQKLYYIHTPSFDARKLFANKSIDFNIEYQVNGSQKFEFIPIGKETKMHLTSSWKDPSFMGEYLPQNPDKINENGFDAYWTILEMNRPFGQEFTDLPDLSDYKFGVELIIPIDDYQQNERSAKYGYLVIALTFLIFFLFQLLSKINIHPFQYLMIGLALIIFYTLLLSITEHSNFSTAYFVSSIATVGLITFYSKSILKTWKFAFFIFLSLSILYGFIYTIIQLENYALLVGSIGLFAILAGVMYASRKIEWRS
jgi:inner membrane protein